MQITWYGLSCFRLAERGLATVVADPYDSSQAGYSPLKLNSQIVTISHNSPGHNCMEAVTGSPHIITGPGEYEIGGVFITGIQTSSPKGEADTRNTLYVYVFYSLSVADLGDLNRAPTQSEVEAIGPVNIALVPVGGGNSLNAARAAEVVSLLEPNMVVPMHYATPGCRLPLDGLNKFLKEMGISEIETQPSLEIGEIALPEETKIIVLDRQPGERSSP
jgi:L-ascorbate metabolism protein UlaG (beta-lactamase superfamily)